VVAQISVALFLPVAHFSVDQFSIALFSVTVYSVNRLNKPLLQLIHIVDLYDTHAPALCPTLGNQLDLDRNCWMITCQD